jgi:hypothetical protein
LIDRTPSRTEAIRAYRRRPVSESSQPGLAMGFGTCGQTVIPQEEKGALICVQCERKASVVTRWPDEMNDAMSQRRGGDARDSGSERNPKLDGRMFGASLADVFRTPAYDCKALGSDQKPEFAVTRLCSGPREMEKAPAYPPDQAVLICVSLTPASGAWPLGCSFRPSVCSCTAAIPASYAISRLAARLARNIGFIAPASQDMVPAGKRGARACFPSSRDSERIVCGGTEGHSPEAANTPLC